MFNLNPFIYVIYMIDRIISKWDKTFNIEIQHILNVFILKRKKCELYVFLIKPYSIMLFT